MVRPRTVKRNEEGGSIESYEAGFPVSAEIWPAGGKVQAEVYGERLAYIRNCRISGSYQTVRKDGTTVYCFPEGELKEKDGICVEAEPGERPDYRIIAIRPYRELYLELEKQT